MPDSRESSVTYKPDHSIRYITTASTRPSRGCRNACASRPTIAKPKRCHNATARFIGADHEVELHGQKAPRPCVRERMLAHGPRHALPARRRRCHVPAIGHMRAAPLLIGPQVVGAQHLAVPLGHEDFVTRRLPVGQRVGPAHLAGQRISFAGPDDRADDVPDRVIVTWLRGSDLHRFMLATEGPLEKSPAAYSAGAARRGRSTSLTRNAITRHVPTRADATHTVDHSTRSKPPRPYRNPIAHTATPDTAKVRK